MNSQHPNGWPPASAGNVPPGNTDSHPQAPQRPIGAFGSSYPSQQGPSNSAGGPVLPPPSGPFYSAQPNGHSLPTLAGIAQASPLPPSRTISSVHQAQSPPSRHSQQAPAPPPPQYQSQALPTLNQAIHHSSPQAILNAERDRDRDRDRERELHDLREREMRDFENRGFQRHQEAIMQQQREQQERDLQQPPPHENHTGSIPLQQPIASRVPSTLHGPNGILSNLGVGVGANAAASSLGAPSGPSNVFSNSNHGLAELPRNFASQPGQTLAPQQMLGMNGSISPQQLPNGVQGMTQGQQPILNDALSYLDQVKVRFVDHPDVYNRFLDIMKDFKSQAIDTPGVIQRVSNLFTGHPELIQGFNTFLPQGYRIECGTQDDPNAIRVTTPMGTTVSQMPSLHDRLPGSNGIAVSNPTGSLIQNFDNNSQLGSAVWQPQSQSHLPTSMEDQFSPNGQARQILSFPQHQSSSQLNGAQYEPQDEQAAALTHQQEQVGVSHLQDAVTAAANGAHGRHSLMQVSPRGGQGMSMGQPIAGPETASGGVTPGTQMVEKRGPVEFNHAISYVNKIKNRFATQPEIYKSFLEILQTYQRESKPIGEVYQQVTLLFNQASDLLEDFKQFLPESAAQAKAQAAARQATDNAAVFSSARESTYLPRDQVNRAQTPGQEVTKMPLMGNFAPPLSAGKESKKRRTGPASQMNSGVRPSMISDNAPGVPSQTIRNDIGMGGNMNKRSRLQATKAAAPEVPIISPTLVPALPTPMPPGPSEYAGTKEELAWFERVKKVIGNRQTFNEFLKLCNLWSQDLIDKHVLVQKMNGFIGSHAQLMIWFKNFIKYDERDEVIENKPILPAGKVVLSNCRGLGPSYRLLPKRERLRTCSGRDEMCQAVLNDEWASHPTWASEDSGFIAHRKNVYEEGLHRIEEERHDYDFWIETCLKTIQLMEPILQQILTMSEEERNGYQLPRALGGQSEFIYQRVIKKIYDRKRGQTVIDEMFKRPAAVLPVLLARLKQKAEEWKAFQLEWEKVWRDQTPKIYYKSLDHQGITAKTTDRRQFQAKTLFSEIQTRYEEQKRQRLALRHNIPPYQFEYYFEDMDIIQDASQLLLTYLHHAHAGNGSDQPRLQSFIKTLIPTFFGIDRDLFQQKIRDVSDEPLPNEEDEDESPGPEEATVSRGRRAVPGKATDLRRGVLEKGKNGKSGRKETDDSKEPTPDVLSAFDEDTMSIESHADQNVRLDPIENRWMEHPVTGTGFGRQAIDPSKPYRRDTYSLYCNGNIYCFFRTFQTLCERLAYIKANEEHVHEDVRRAEAAKPAHDLKYTDKFPSDYFVDTSPQANYYKQILRLCENVIKGELDINQVEDTLRRFYMQHGWQLYNFDKLLSSIIRFALQVITNDNKEKGNDIINIFYKDRSRTETTHTAELDYRKSAERLVKEGDVYRITYTEPKQRATVRILKKEDKTFDSDSMAAHEHFLYYVSTYVLRDQTEGIDLSRMRFPLLRRNVPPMLDTEDEYSTIFSPQWNMDGLTLSIGPETYQIKYDKGTEDWFVHGINVQKRGISGMEDIREERKAKFGEKFGTNTGWMTGRRRESVERIMGKYRQWVENGSPSDEDVQGSEEGDKIVVAEKAVAEEGEGGDEDEDMAGT